MNLRENKLMRINLIEADESKIRELENESAFTWEGMNLDEENLNEIARIFIEKQLVKKDTEKIYGFIWYGDTMNHLYNLHGDNQYKNDLPFLCFDNKTFNGTGNLNVFKLEIGARWLDDIVRNNFIKENKE